MLLEIINTIGLASLGFLIWTVRTFIASQLRGQATEIGKIQGRVAALDDLANIETRLKQAAADVEIATRRVLDLENATLTKRLDFRERQLAEFYWPLYMRLQMDNAVWERMAQITPESPVRDRKLAQTVEEKFILPNHRKALRVIQTKIHLADGDVDLERHLLSYVRHLAVFEALRALDVHDRDPKDVGEPWPHELFPIVARLTKERQAEFDRYVLERDKTEKAKE